MVILSLASVGTGSRNLNKILLLGSGLVGSSIAKSLLAKGWNIEKHIAIDWIDHKTRGEQINAIFNIVHSAVEFKAHIDVIWAAGNSRFNGEQSIFDREWAAFSDILNLTTNLSDTSKSNHLTFHYVSSAGGLFDGMMMVKNSDNPDPQNCYGFSKLKQEQAVLSLPQAVRTQIYRPSSIYGYARNGKVGLITMLILDALDGKVTKISSDPTTARDFIFADDVGDFVSEYVSDDSALSQIHTLASGRTTSILEAIELVRKALPVPLNIQFNPKPAQPINNSYSASALPENFKPTPIDVGIEKAIRQIHESKSHTL